MKILLKFSKDTGDLFVELKNDNNIDKYLNRNREEMLQPMPLHEYLSNLLIEKNLNKQEIIKKSNLDEVYAYHIFSGNRKNPSRPKILAIGFAMELNLEEMQYLLRYAKQSPLYPRNQWDSVIISAIEQKLNVIDTNLLLNQLGETILLE